MPKTTFPRTWLRALCSAACMLSLPLFAQDKSQPRHPEVHPHNVILFVADGLRRNSVTAERTPNLYRVRQEGVDFRNSHSLYPTFTTANASAIATGHGLGDTGDYANVLWPGFVLAHPGATFAPTIVPFLESDEILASMNAAFRGNYLGERALLSEARAHGFNVASVGKIGPTGLQQIDSITWASSGVVTTHDAIILDDVTGSKAGIALPEHVTQALNQAEVPTESPSRSNGYADSSAYSNGFSGDARHYGTRSANVVQQQWMNDVATRVLLPAFAADATDRGKPFVLLYWCRDPDASQHNQGDSPDTLTPGINGPTALAAVLNADRALGALLSWLDAHPEIKATTDVVITSDHGFATLSRREIDGSSTPTETLADAPPAPAPLADGTILKPTLPLGFLALDLGRRLNLNVFDPARPTPSGPAAYAQIPLADKTRFPSSGSALLGETLTHADGTDAKIIVASNGGSDLLYFPTRDEALIRQTLSVLSTRDYVGGLFVDDRYCQQETDCPGALQLSSIGLKGSSAVPRPAIVVAFRHFFLDPADLQTGVQISDSSLKEGQGQHGGFARDQTFNNMAAMGPDFKPGPDDAAMGNADIAPTLASILGFDLPSNGSLRGRVLHEALLHGAPPPKIVMKTETSAPTPDGRHTVLEFQVVEGRRYYDQACLIAQAINHCP